MPASALGGVRCHVSRQPLSRPRRPTTASLTGAYAAHQHFNTVLRGSGASKGSPESEQQSVGQRSSVGSMSQSIPTMSAPQVPQPPVPGASVQSACSTAAQGGWSHAMMAYYLAADRNWKAVEDFYIRLVSGTACLTELGLAPAAAPAAPLAAPAAGPACRTNVSSMQAVQDVQQQNVLESPQQQEKKKQQQHERRTYKMCVSYLGSSFAGWARQPGRRSVEETLAAAVAAAGLTGGSAGDKNSKRAAARAARRAEQKKAKNTTGDVSAAAARPAEAASNGSVEASVCKVLAPCTAAAAAGATGTQQTGDETGVARLGRLSGPAAAAVSSAAAAGGGNGGDAVAVTLPTLAVAGRTDAGVTAVGQVISFHRYGDPLPSVLLLQQLNTQLTAVVQAQGAAVESRDISATSAISDSHLQPASSSFTLPVSSQLRAWSACEVPRQFHATFSASWRRYVYLLPLRQQQQPFTGPGQSVAAGLIACTGTTPLAAVDADLQLFPQYSTEIQEAVQGVGLQGMSEKAAVQQAVDVNADRVNALLQQLQGRSLDYSAYARDTPKGKGCQCTLHVARASLVHISVNAADRCKERQQTLGVDAGRSSHQQHHNHSKQQCLCIELVGDRFLRRMVRVLVATAIRESVQDAAAFRHQTAAAVADSSARSAGLQSLVQLAELCDRNKTAAAAPSLGLCFAAAGYHM